MMNMTSRKYTAEELREMATAVLNECTDEENGLVYESRYFAGHVFYPDEAAAMLRQGADAIDKCRAINKKTNKHNALARLAEKLNADADVILTLKEYLGDKENEIGGMMIQDIREAGRIITELAREPEIFG